MTAMEARSGFGVQARGFTMTVSLQEGYNGGRCHEAREVIALLRGFAVEKDIEFGCEVLPATVVYSYRSDGAMVVHDEPAVNLVGLFPPNKFGEKSEADLVAIVAALAAHLAPALGQTSIHAEVCGKHHAWKISGSMTAHELAQPGGTQ